MTELVQRRIQRWVIKTQSYGMFRILYAGIYKIGLQFSVLLMSRMSGVLAIYIRESSHQGDALYGIGDIDLFVVTPDFNRLEGKGHYNRIDSLRSNIEFVFPFLGIDIVEGTLFRVMYVERGGIFAERRTFRLLSGVELFDRREHEQALAELPRLNGVIYFLNNTLRRIPLRDGDLPVIAALQHRCYAKICRNLLYFDQRDTHPLLTKIMDRRGFFEPYFLAFDRLDRASSAHRDMDLGTETAALAIETSGSGGFEFDLKEEPGERAILTEIAEFLKSIPKGFIDTFSSVILSSTPCAYRSYRLYFLLPERSNTYDSLYSDQGWFEEFYRICSTIKRRISLHAHNPYIMTPGMLRCFLDYVDHNTLPWEEYYLKRNAEVLYGSEDFAFFGLPGYEELKQRIGIFILLADKLVKSILYEGRSCYQNRIILWMNYVFGMMPACKSLLFKKMVVTTPGESQAEYLRSDFSDRDLFEEVWRKYASEGIYLDEIKRDKSLQEAIILDTSDLLLSMIHDIKSQLSVESHPQS